MKLRSHFALTLLVAVSLLVPGTFCPPRRGLSQIPPNPPPRPPSPAIM